MKARITKTFTFDAGHRLMLHPGLCNNLHGHTYRLEVSLSGEMNPETGMVMDFKHLKDLVNKRIELMDHAMILNEKDSFVIDFCRRNRYKIYTMPIGSEPTAENIAQVFKDALQSQFIQFIINIKLWETPTSFVEV